MKYLTDSCNKFLCGNLDSDGHINTIFSIALTSRGTTYLELGVREGHTTEPLYEAKLNNGHLWSVGINPPSEYKPNKPNNRNYTFHQGGIICD